MVLKYIVESFAVILSSLFLHQAGSKEWYKGTVAWVAFPTTLWWVSDSCNFIAQSAPTCLGSAVSFVFQRIKLLGWMIPPTGERSDFMGPQYIFTNLEGHDKPFGLYLSLANTTRDRLEQLQRIISGHTQDIGSYLYGLICHSEPSIAPPT